RIVSEINDDLTGSRVAADKPVAVWSGSTCVTLPFGNTSCGPMIEQLPPLEGLGTRFFVARYPGEPRTYWKGVASCGDAQVTSTGLLLEVDSLVKDGAFISELTFEDGIAESSTPILMAHLGVNISRSPPSGLDSAVGDPSLALITPREQMARQHHFVVPSLPPRNDGVQFGWKHFVSVARPDVVTNATLNGVGVNFTGFFGVVEVDPGRYDLVASGPVAVTVNGRSVSDAYAFVPAPVVQRGVLQADGIYNHICGEEFDTTIQVSNAGVSDIVVESVEFTNGLQGVMVTPSLPITLAAGESIPVQLSFYSLRSGVDSGALIFRQTLCRERILLELPIRLKPDRLALTPPSGTLLTFPSAFPVTPTVDAQVVITNPTTYPVTVTSAVISPASIALANPSLLPFTLAPGASQPVDLRYTPVPGDREVTGRIDFYTANCPDTSYYGLDLKTLVRYVRAVEPATLTLRCEPKDVDTLTLYIVNYDALPLIVNQGTVIGGDAGEFQLIPTNTFPLSIPAKDSARFDILYTPGSLGTRTATLQLVLSGGDTDTLNGTLRVENELAELSMSVVALDFGRVLCDTVGPRRFNIRNTGTLPLEGLRVELVRGDDFRLERKGSDPALPGEELIVEVFPTARPGRDAHDTIRVVEPICGAELLIPVRSRCIARGSLRIGFANESKEIGSVLPIPLYLQSDPQSFAVGAPVQLRLVVRFAADMLLPEDLDSLITGAQAFRLLSTRVEGKERLLELEVTGRLSEDGSLGEIPMLVLLGSRFTTPLAVEDFSFSFLSDLYEGEAEPVDGNFTALGWCAVGTPRLVDGTGAFGLKVLPNPVQNEARVQVDLVEDGGGTLLLLDESGREVLSLTLESAEAGSWLVRLPVAGLPAGAYSLLLQTPTQSVRRGIIVR
ncbi:MAG: hypothetical protein AB7H80_15960, partial [Candidatus Kapaibacterium sp.]